MHKIITIGREFGSGGRELGKRLSEALGIAYYDNEIITGIAQKSGLAEEYVKSIVERKPITYPITTGRTLNTSIGHQFELNMMIYEQQNNVIKELASKSDCVMIGRCSDYILREHKPFNIFVYANMDSRLQRCRLKAPEGEHLSDTEMKSMILSVDKYRARYYKSITGQEWGEKHNYNLCINTSNVVVKDVVLPISKLLKAVLYENK